MLQLEKQRDRLCEWVLDVSRRLLDPADDETDATAAPRRKPDESDATVLSESRPVPGRGSSAIGSQLQFFSAEHSTAEERFRHFVARISRLQASGGGRNREQERVKRAEEGIGRLQASEGWRKRTKEPVKCISGDGRSEHEIL